MRRKVIVGVLLVAGSAGLVAAFPERSKALGRTGWQEVKGLLQRLRPRPQTLPDREREPVVRVHTQGPERYVRLRRYYGEIEPDREARLSFEVAGRVKAIHFRENAVVGTAKPLAELDPALFVARHDRRVAELAKAQRDLKRNRELRRKNVISLRILQDSETAVDLQQAALKEAAEQLARTKLFSPFAGYLVRREVERGEMVQPGRPAFTVMALDSVKLVVWVPEYRVPELAGNQRCTVRMPAFPGRDFAGRVQRVPLAARKQGRTFGVEIHIANPDHVLRPGMIGQARIETLTLPKAWRFEIGWVRRHQGRQVVHLFVPDTTGSGTGLLRRVALVKPFRDGSYWIARGLKGIEPGTTVRLVTAGFEGLQAGQRVRLLAAKGQEVTR